MVNELMKLLHLMILLVCSTGSYAQHVLSEHEKDSLGVLVCNMQHADQDVRKRWEEAKKDGDSVTMRSVGDEWHITDSMNFIVLENITRNVGYPCPQLLGKAFKFDCFPHAILIHWMKNHPEWFCDRSLIPVFRKEIELGHLPLSVMDFCFFAYVSYMKADIKLMARVNEARTAYGLKAYTKKQYTQQEYMEPLMGDDNASRRKAGVKIKQVPERSSGAW
ncbi:MAG: hypothetical protein BGO69_18305 [Bacteroidetes bacterium 46-16]|nr:MAG: hypothetical protein BGO69_18305 [Bacteroidetes bacterium 46-16]